MSAQLWNCVVCREEHVCEGRVRLHVGLRGDYHVGLSKVCQPGSHKNDAGLAPARRPSSQDFNAPVGRCAGGRGRSYAAPHLSTAGWCAATSTPCLFCSERACVAGSYLPDRRVMYHVSDIACCCTCDVLDCCTLFVIACACVEALMKLHLWGSVCSRIVIISLGCVPKYMPMALAAPWIVGL